MEMACLVERPRKTVLCEMSSEGEETVFVSESVFTVKYERRLKRHLSP
jgi:hypothetical protein